ncbi:hypothetical protein Ddye_003761 [Dipteronia dyeriana]|uniref:TF-B3 domain-containing protein n=1 Tax=Dipteronia dyeriana TaxID=168575 RepID=A0AAE0CVL3_9ROSI|nr:hypothetical protein Ddye_003761 [Dipteronia dyeriana]
MPRPCFHKLILSSTIQERKLRIPDNFIKRFKHDLSMVATLTVPNGNVSRVGLRRAENKVWIIDGWQDFMERYSIGVGYFLVFRYQGNSAFNVYIFNLPSSEINYQSNSLGSTVAANHSRQYHIFAEMEDDESENADQLSLNKNVNSPGLQNLFSGSKHNNNINYASEGNLHQFRGYGNSQAGNQSTRDVGVQFDIIELKNSLNALYSPDGGSQKLKKAGRKKRKIDPNNPDSSATVEREEEVDMRFRFYESASARKRTVTAEERERAINAAKTFEPINPFCRVVLRPSYLYRGCIMYLPSCFAEKHLNGVSGFIKLQLSDGKQWPVRCLYRGGRAKFSQGWYEFTVENNLGEGDVCVFEVLRSREFVLKVTVFRVMEGAGFMNRLSH